MNAKTPFALKSLAIAVMAVSLAACSDSDSDSSPGAGSGSDPVTPASLTGTAAKGILIGAEVLACTTPRLSECASSNSSNRLGSAFTDGNGNYTIENLPSDGQGVFIHVRRPTTGTPQMVCDLPQGCGAGQAFGDLIDMPNLSLRSVAVLDGPSVEASVTPLTELVAAAAERSGDGQISRAAIAEGNRAVREALGLGDMTELQTIRPVDITQTSASEASPEAQRLSLLSAAFAETVVNGNIVTSGLDELSQALSDSSEINTETLNAIKTQVTEIASTWIHRITATLHHRVEEGGPVPVPF